MPYKVVIKANGQEFEVPNVTGFQSAISRSPAQDGNLGQANHNVHPLTIEREIQDAGGQSDTESKIAELAAGCADEAYFSGEVEYTLPTDPNKPFRTYRWERGHICGMSTMGRGDNMVDSIEVAVTGLTLNNSKFETTAG